MQHPLSAQTAQMAAAYNVSHQHLQFSPESNFGMSPLQQVVQVKGLACRPSCSYQVILCFIQVSLLYYIWVSVNQYRDNMHHQHTF